MPTMTQALSAVGSLALVVGVLLGWWLLDIREKETAAQNTYTDLTGETTIAERRQSEARAKVLELEDELAELDAAEKKTKDQLDDGDARLADVEKTVNALRARADVHWRLLGYLSYALTDVGDDRSTAEKEVLGTDFMTDRAAFAKVVRRADAVVFSGEALFEEEVERLTKRLRAAGYLGQVRKGKVVRLIDKDYAKPYYAFEIGSEIRHPPVVDLGDER